MTRAERALATLGLATAILSISALHVLEPDFDPLRRFMSEYILGPYGWMMRAAFFGLAASGGSLGSWFWRERRPLSALGMIGWSIGMVIAGLFRCDSSLPDRVRTLVGFVHDVGADGAFVAMVIAQSAGPRYGRVFALVMVLAVVLLNVLALPGLGQRVFGVLAIGWQLAVLRVARRR